MSKKEVKNEFIKKDTESALQPFLVPISIILAGVMIMVSVLFSATKILDRDELLTKQNLKTTLNEAIKEANLSTGGTAATTQPTPTQVPISLDQVKALFAKSGEYITFGDTSKKVIFVEFSDPSCPFCHAAAGKNSELNNALQNQGYNVKLVKDGGTYIAPVEEMKKLVDSGEAAFAWVYDNGHSAGERSTVAMYCAYEQGKFWEAHDLLMSNAGYSLINNQVKNDRANDGLLVDFLKGVLDADKLKSCLDSKKYDDRIQRDLGVAAQFGTGGTPAFFVNETRIGGGAVSYSSMKSIVDQALAK